MGWNRVAIVGAGMVKFGELFDKTLEGLCEEAYLNSLESVDKGLDPKEIEYACIGTCQPILTGMMNTGGSTLTSSLGLGGIPGMRVELGCPTGQAAVHVVAMAIAAGICDVGIAVGVEKMRESPTTRLLGLGMMGHPALERGQNAMSQFAAQAVRYMYEYGATIDHFSMVSVKNRYNGSFNPYAHFSQPVTKEDCIKSPLVCYPFHILHCCPQTDGAASIIMCNADIASKYTDKPIYLAGFSLGTDTQYHHEKESFVSMKATVEAAKRAYGMAGVGASDLDLAEVHDCFASQEILNYEDLGFCERGMGWKLLEKGEWNMDGRLPVNPSGGLICEGHPLGATGVRQAVEIFWQLRGEVADKQKSKRQVEVRKGYALQHNVGGRGINNAGVSIWTLHS